MIRKNLVGSPNVKPSLECDQTTHFCLRDCINYSDHDWWLVCCLWVAHVFIWFWDRDNHKSPNWSFSRFLGSLTCLGSSSGHFPNHLHAFTSIYILVPGCHKILTTWLDPLIYHLLVILRYIFIVYYSKIFKFIKISPLWSEIKILRF